MELIHKIAEEKLCAQVERAEKRTANAMAKIAEVMKIVHKQTQELKVVKEQLTITKQELRLLTKHPMPVDFDENLAIQEAVVNTIQRRRGGSVGR